MPDVGVLELQIRDNAEQAGGGLGNLADAISRVKTAVGKGLGLGSVATQVTKLASTINAEKSTSTTLKNLSSLFNAISNFSKLGKVNIDVKPFKDIKEALGNGISLGQAGTQLKNIREAMTGDWDASGSISNMHGIVAVGREIKESGTAKSFNELAKSLNNYAKAYKSLPKDSAKISNVVRDIMDTGRIEAGNILSNNVSGNIVDYSKIADEWDKEQKLIFREPLEDSFESVRNQLDNLFEPNTDGLTSSIQEEFQQVNSTIQESTESVKEYKASIEATTQTFGENAKDAVVKDVSSSVAFLTERWKNAANEVGTYGNRITDAVLPKMNELSAEEMIIKKNGEMATAAIERLITRLNTVGNKSGKGYSGIVDLMTGVSRGGVSTSSAEESANAISKNLDQIIEVEKELDRVAEIQSRISNAAAESKPIINMENIPASGNNGPFANAAEEVEYLKSKLNEAKESLSQWESVYERTQKQIKYNGATEERTNMLGHAEEGFYSQLEQIKQLEEEISKLCTYAQNYSTSMQNVQDTVAPVASSIQEVANSAEFSKKAMQTMFEHQQQRIAVIRELNKESSDKVKEQVAALIGLKPEDIWGKAVTEIQNATNAVQEYGSAMASVVGDNNVRDYGNELVENLANNYNQIDLYEMKLDGMKQALASDINMNKVDTQQIAERMLAIQALTEKIEEMRKAQEKSSEATEKMRSAWAGFKDGIKNMFPTLSSLLKRFAQIVKYRMLRAVLKHITSGFSEGVENVYNYSKLVGTELAPAMDSAATSFQQLKNSIGAAVAPLITAFIPVINQVVSVVITGINYLNQFFALLNGQKTWTRALPATTTAFDKQTKAAKGAGAAIKDLLADWDELNIIQSESSGGGSGGSSKTAEDYLSMFEEVDKFSDKVKSAIDFIKDNMSSILTLAASIGAAILGWKLSKAFEGFLPILSKIGTGLMSLATIGITLALTDITGKAFIANGSPAWFIADALTGALGSTLAGKLAAKIAGVGVGEVVQGFTLILAGAINIKNAVEAATQEEEAKAFMLNALGAVEIGIGAALAAMGFGAGATVSLATGAITGIAALVIGIELILEAKKKATYRKMAIDAFRQAGENGISPEAYLEALQKRMDELMTGSKLVVDASLGFDEHSESFKSTIESLKSLNALVGGNEKLSEEDATKFKNAWEIVLNELREISKIDYATMYAGLDEAIAHGTDTIKEAALEYRKQAIEAAGIMGGAQEKMNKEMEFLTNAISSGTATDEDLERYKEIYSVLAGETETGLENFKKALKEGAAFDFSNGENPVDEAVSFINSLGTDLIQPALDQVEAQYNAEIDAVKRSQEELENMHKLGYIGEPNYNQLKEFYEGLINTYTARLEEQKKEITESTQGAFDAILNQTLDAYLGLDQKDEDLLKRYVEDVFDPIVKAVEEAGGEVPDKIRAVLARGGESAVRGDVVRQIIDSTREGIYEAFKLDMEHENIGDALTFSIAYELDLHGQNIDQIADEEKKEIVNALYSVFEDPQRIFQGLNEKFGWTFEDILSYMDLGNFNKEQLNELLNVIDLLHSDEFERLQQRAHQTPNSPGYLDWFEYQDQADASNASFERMKQLINNMINLGGPSAVGGGGGAPEMYANAGEYQEPHDISGEVAVGVSGVESGVSTLHSDQGLLLHELNQLVSLCNQIARKEFVVNVNASSGWGSHNQRSQDLYERITGEVKA